MRNKQPVNTESTLSQVSKEIVAGRLTNVFSLRSFLTEKTDLIDSDIVAISNALAPQLVCPSPHLSRIELFLTSDCNLRCSYCFVENKSSPEQMDLVIGKGAVDFLIAESGTHENLEIMFFGGEPLLAAQLMQDIVVYAEDKTKSAGKKVQFTMTTNGLLLNEPLLSFLRDHNVMLLISVDGNQESYNRYRRLPAKKDVFGILERRIKSVQRSKIKYAARMTIMPRLADQIVTNVRYLYDELGFRHIQVAPASGVEWTDEDMETYRHGMLTLGEWYLAQKRVDYDLSISTFSTEDECEEMQGWGCQAGRNSVSILPSGKISPCSKIFGVEKGTPAREGKDGIILGDISKGWMHPKLRRALIEYAPDPDQQCYQCDYRDHCNGGCFATNLQESGDLFKPGDWDCRFAKMDIDIRRELGFIPKLTRKTLVWGASGGQNKVSPQG